MTNSQARKEALNLLAVRRACATAVSSTDLMVESLSATEIEEFVDLSRQRMELEIATRDAEDALLDKMTIEMTYDDCIRTLFDVVDTDCNGFLSAEELIAAFQIINDSKHGQDEPICPHATEVINHYTYFATREVSAVDFGEFLDVLSAKMQCSVQNLTRLVVLRLPFAQTGREILEDSASSLVRESIPETKLALESSIQEARLQLIFDMMDLQMSDRVDSYFLKLVLLEVALNASEQLGALLNYLQDSSQSNRQWLDFNQFKSFLVDLVLSLDLDHYAVHRMMDFMTLKAARSQQMDTDKLRTVLSQLPDADISFDSQDGVQELLEYGKLGRLFDLIDLDHNGYIDVQELTIAIRKLQDSDAKMSKETAEHIMDAIKDLRFGDQLLNKEKFAKLISRLADGAGKEVFRFVDFMLVQCALSDEKESTAQDEKQEQEAMPTVNSERSRDEGNWISRVAEVGRGFSSLNLSLSREPSLAA